MPTLSSVRRRLRFPVVAGLVLAVSVAAPAAARNPLTPAEVECNAEQLRGILDRSEVFVNDASRVRAAYASYGSPFGDLTLVARSHFGADGNFSGQPESDLWVSVNPYENPMLLNHERLQLPTVGMTRSEQNSAIVEPSDPGMTHLVVNPTLDLVAAPSNSHLVINNQKQGYPLAFTSHNRPGRGLTQLLKPCPDKTSGKLVAEDIHVFRVLQKLVTTSTRQGLVGNSSPAVKTAIFRGEAPDTYLLDVYPVDANDEMSHGRARFTFRVDLGPGGRLDGGAIDPFVAQEAADGYTIDLWLIGPAFGETRIPGLHPFEYAFLQFDQPGGYFGQRNDDIDWEVLLPDRSDGSLHPWRKPLGN